MNEFRDQLHRVRIHTNNMCLCIYLNPFEIFMASSSSLIYDPRVILIKANLLTDDSD